MTRQSRERHGFAVQFPRRSTPLRPLIVGVSLLQHPRKFLISREAVLERLATDGAKASLADTDGDVLGVYVLLPETL